MKRIETEFWKVFGIGAIVIGIIMIVLSAIIIQNMNFEKIVYVHKSFEEISHHSNLVWFTINWPQQTDSKYYIIPNGTINLYSNQHEKK